MPNAHGSFCWYTNFVADDAEAKAAVAFYGEVIGWKFESMDMGDFTYHLLKTGETGRGGIRTVPMPMPSHWASYLAVDDVDAGAETVKANGGMVMSGPHDIPNVGRYAACADPKGATFLLFKSANKDDGDLSPEVGAFHWTELWSKDIADVLDFYTAVTGWTVGSMPMPDGSTYSMFMDGEVPRGGGMAPQQDWGRNMWVPWVHVDDVDSALVRTENSGGKVVMPASDMPNIGRLSVITDPNGCVLGLITPAK